MILIPFSVTTLTGFLGKSKASSNMIPQISKTIYRIKIHKIGNAKLRKQCLCFSANKMKMTMHSFLYVSPKETSNTLWAINTVKMKFEAEKYEHKIAISGKA